MSSCDTRPFPIQRPSRDYPRPWGGSSIPWYIAEKAYTVYQHRWRTSQTLERLAERGGFCVSEMDEFHPAWRDEVAEYECATQTLDLEAAYPLPQQTFTGSLLEQLVDRADVAQRLALRASNPLARHYYLGAARGFREAIALLPLPPYVVGFDLAKGADQTALCALPPAQLEADEKGEGG
jgi:hypothetical protein